MMAIKHTHTAGAHPADAIGARQDILIWGYGVTTGRVVAVQVLECGGVDLVVEFDRPEMVIVPEGVCERVGNCRFDTKCASFVPCARRATGGSHE